MALNPVLYLLALLVSGTMVGNEIAVGLFVHPRLDGLPDAVYAPARVALARAFGAIMPFWYAATLLLTVAVAGTLRGSPVFILALIAAGIEGAVIVATVLFLAPLNARIAAWDVDDLADDWRTEAARWDKMHFARIGFLGLAFALLVAACLSNRL